MSHTIAVCGIATPTGLYARCGDGWRKLEPTREPIVALSPLGVSLAALLAAGVEPCPVCERYACQCPDPDPHGDLSELQKLEIPV